MKKSRIIKMLVCMTLIGGLVIKPFSSIVQDVAQQENMTLEKYMHWEASNHTTSLEPEIEKKLNEAGLADADIECLNPDTIKDIEAGREFKVNVSFLEEGSTDGEMSTMTDVEVDKLIDEIYGEGSVDGGNLLTTETVNAATSGTTSSGKVKFSIVSTKTSSGVYAISNVWRWVKPATYNQNDVVNVYINYGSIRRESIKGTCIIYDEYQQKYLSEVYTYAKNANRIKHDPKGVAVTFNKSAGYRTNDSMTVYFKLDVDKNQNSFTAWADYYHMQSKVTVTPSVSVGTSGKVSFSGVVKLTNVMKKLNADCSIKQKY